MSRPVTGERAIHSAKYEIMGLGACAVPIQFKIAGNIIK